MHININPKLKPLSANLKRLEMGSFLVQKEFHHILEEYDYDTFWKQCLEMKNKNERIINFSIDFEENTIIFIIGLNRIFNDFNENKNKEFNKSHFNIFLEIGLVYFIENCNIPKDYTKLIHALEELYIVEKETIKEIKKIISIKENEVSPKIEIIQPHNTSKKYQIFISSTYIDLIEERQAAVQSILKKGHIPAGMELFSANDKSQWEVIKKWIDNSDIYVLIFGGRYGTIDNETGLSYTEMEYNYAIEKQKPFFTLVLDDEILNRKSIEIIRDYDLKNEKYINFKRKITSKMCSFPQNNDQIKLHINDSLDTLISNHRDKMHGWVKGIIGNGNH